MRARHAAHRLAPLLVRRGGGPLCEGSASHVETIDGQSWLTLAPVAAHALCPEASSEPLYVHSTDPGIGHWTLVARHARAIDPRTLAVALEGARMEDQLDRRRIAAEGLVLVASRGVGDLRALPIRDVSNDMCSFHSSRGFPPGTSLGTVIVVGDQGVLRRAPAAVVGSHPFVRSDGGSSFLVRARFDVAPLPEPIDYDVVDDPDQVRRLLELAGLLAVPLDDSGHRIERVSRDRLEFSSEVPADPWRFRFRLFGMAYEAMVRRVSIDRTSFPLVLRRCQRRTDERTEIPMGEPMQIAFTNPITGTRVQERVLDVSVGGLRFSAGERNILWHELKLADADLLTAHSTIPLGTLEVRGLEPTSTRIECHAQFLLPPDQRSRDLYDLVARLRRPELTPHDGAAFEPQMTLYRRMGLLMPYMEDQLRSGDAEANWRRAHAPESGICRTLHRVENDEVVASVTALRAWNDTWLGEHLAAIPGRGGCTPGTLLLAFLEDVLPRPTCRHMVFFTKSGNAKMAGLHQRFQELTGTAEAMACAELRVWMVRRLRQVEPTGSLPLPMREARAADISLIARAASRDLGHLAARASRMGRGRLPVGST